MVRPEELFCSGELGPGLKSDTKTFEYIPVSHSSWQAQHRMLANLKYFKSSLYYLIVTSTTWLLFKQFIYSIIQRIIRKRSKHVQLSVMFFLIFLVCDQLDSQIQTPQTETGECTWTCNLCHIFIYLTHCLICCTQPRGPPELLISIVQGHKQQPGTGPPVSFDTLELLLAIPIFSI